MKRNYATLTNYELADSMFKRALGIMFRERISRPMLFVFPYTGRISIHSFFCPLFDAVFLDSRKRVIEIHERIPPGRMITSDGQSRYLIELPPGAAARMRLKKGTVIKFGR